MRVQQYLGIVYQLIAASFVGYIIWKALVRDFMPVSILLDDIEYTPVIVGSSMLFFVGTLMLLGRPRHLKKEEN